MKKLVPIALALLAAVILVRRFAGGERMDWEARIAKMPENSPPRWMFTNIRTIRDNTETLLERMDELAPRQGSLTE